MHGRPKPNKVLLTAAPAGPAGPAGHNRHSSHTAAEPVHPTREPGKGEGLPHHQRRKQESCLLRLPVAVAGSTVAIVAAGCSPGTAGCSRPDGCSRSPERVWERSAMKRLPRCGLQPTTLPRIMSMSVRYCKARKPLPAAVSWPTKLAVHDTPLHPLLKRGPCTTCPYPP